MDLRVIDRRNLILITRPLEDARTYAEELESEGFKTFVEPLLEIVVQDFYVPDLSQYRGLIFTSANAVRIFSSVSPDRDIEIYCVGPNTYKQAFEKGYNHLHNANGGGGELIQLLQKNIKKEPEDHRPFLHIRGEQVAQPIEEMLAAKDIKVEMIVGYRAEKIKKFSELCIQKFKDNEVGAVTFFSRRTAENFIALINESGLITTLSQIKALCISQSVLECVQVDLWADAYVAAQPDGQSMKELIRKIHVGIAEEYEEKNIMSKANENAIGDAESVIEKFGGIRPMASKMSVPVTTVQGWKKRNVIPGARLEALLKAAGEHGVDLGGIVEKSDAANENDRPRRDEAKVDQSLQTRVVPEVRASEVGSEGMEENKDKKKKEKRGGGEPPLPLQNSVEKQFAALEKKAVTRSTIINATLAAVMIAALAFLLWPKVEKMEQIQSEVEAVKVEQSFLRGMVPDGFEQRMVSMQEQAMATQEILGHAVDAAKTISSDVLGEDAGSLQERVIRLETHIADLAGGSPEIVAMLQRAQLWQQSIPGQEKLGQSFSELSALVTSMDGKMENFDGALEQARENSPALGQTFEGVPQEELKAAAMLLGLAKLRSSLNRSNESFESDLELLKNLVGEDNAEMKAAMERLAPHARDGVLTPEGLSAEFRGLAGDVVVASLKGEDVSVQEKAKARLNELFQVEKDGELITGTDTQAALVRTQNLLDEGDLEQAIAQMQTLQGPAAEAIAPFLGKAQASLLAKQMQQIATQTISLRAFGDKSMAAVKGVLPGSSTLIQNEETGINILKPGHQILP